MQAQVKKMYFTFSWVYTCYSIKRDATWIANKVSMLNKKLKTQVRWVKHNRHTLHISLNQEKSDNPISQIGGFGLGSLAPITSFQNLDVPIFSS
jgi:hypothetical protein